MWLVLLFLNWIAFKTSAAHEILGTFSHAIQLPFSSKWRQTNKKYLTILGPIIFVSNGQLGLGYISNLS